MTFDFITISAAYIFAHSDAGEDYIDEHFSGSVLNQQKSHYIDLYTTPRASALAALRNLTPLDLERFYGVEMPLDADDFDHVCDWSVAEYEFQYDDRHERRYAAALGHNDDLVHTDRGGFEDWLRGDDLWFDEEWVIRVDRRRGA